MPYLLYLLYICLGTFLIVLQVGVGCIFSLHTHTFTFTHIMSGALYPGLSELRNRKGLCSNTDRMYFLSQFLRVPQLEFVYFTYMLKRKLFTSCCE